MPWLFPGRAGGRLAGRICRSPGLALFRSEKGKKLMVGSRLEQRQGGLGAGAGFGQGLGPGFVVLAGKGQGA